MMSDAQLETTTIVALATPPGRGGVGIVRLSGPDASRVCRALFPGGATPQPRQATYRLLRDADGTRIDDALLTLFPAPASYTGEDVLEIATHGSPVVLDWLVRACVEHGATPARPGEFTERAFLNGRLDLTGAEAVRDLIDAQTLGQAQLAAQQMGGAIAEAVRPAKQALLHLIATLEAGIDFAEDDLDAVTNSSVTTALETLTPSLAGLLRSFQQGRLLREGLRMAIVGEPNVGKSSLFNRLLQQERAIVTATPGTTRDVIAERLALDGVPVELLDTAGLRETADEAERLGILRSRQALADADAVLLVLDGSEAASRPVLPSDLADALRGRPVVLALNKADLAPSALHPEGSLGVPAATADVQAAEASASAISFAGFAWPVVPTSAVTGLGIDQLKNAILTLARGTDGGTTGAATLTNLRQRDATARALAGLQRAEQAAHSGIPHEMVLLDLYEGLHALDELTGATTPDDVLHLIFSSFCIGK